MSAAAGILFENQALTKNMVSDNLVCSVFLVRFLSTIELINQLEQEKQLGKQGRLTNRLIYTGLVILDEPSYLPGGALLFHLISKLYEKPV